jgi:energy-coupling factor transporter ATP-binding protein EcfA2
MSLVREIATWADAHSEWMSDTAGRLFAQGTLSPADCEDLAAFIKSSVSIPDAMNRKPSRLKLDSMPEAATPGVPVSITALRSPKNLNAIGSPDGITFEPTGLTIVYGYNGSGKSGYARALKKACRARNTEALVPNVFSPPNPPAPASARFEWLAGGVASGADWQDNKPAPGPLSNIAVFDALCARVFIDDQAEISFIPYGMDVMRELSASLTRVQHLLERERDAAKFDMTAFAPLLGTTEVGKVVGALDRKTDVKKLSALSVLNDAEKGELEELKRLLANDETVRQAQAIRRLEQRVRALQDELSILSTPFSDSYIQELRQLFDQLRSAHEATELAAKALKEGTLPGTGTEPWAVLFNSAVEFATGAYEGHPFPGPEGASCVLCQQPLSPEARNRLEGFWRFLQADTQKKYDELRNRTFEKYRPLRSAALGSFPADKTLLDEVAERSTEVTRGVQEYIGALTARQAAVNAMAPKRELTEVNQLPEDPKTNLEQLRKALLEQAAKLEEALTPEQRAAKQQRLGELQAREKLATLLPVVLQGVEWAKLDHLMAEAIKCCNTRKVTEKSGELYEKAVTAELQAALARERKALGVDHISLTLDLSGQKGIRVQRLQLKTTGAAPKVKLSGILSEGEQRAIAIASFLAEVSLEPSNSGIILDDPVNSLDHRRREAIANRLAEEAKKRQVIVFTHDLAFAWELQECSKGHAHTAAVRHIFDAGETKGHCMDKLPFEGQQLKARINVLRELQGRAKKCLEVEKDFDGYNAHVRNGYRMLRDSWEQLVEEHLFNGTVRRFQRPIQTLRLRSVRVNDAEAKAVYDGMTRVSSFVHYGGAEAPPNLPQPGDFLTDIEALAATFERIAANNKLAEEERVGLRIPKR